VIDYKSRKKYIKIWDSQAQDYEYNINCLSSSRLKINLVTKFIQQNHKVLDIGCANGLYMTHLISSCEKITGIDISNKMLDYAKSALSNTGFDNFNLYNQSAASLTFPNESFDLVYSFSTLLLVPDVMGALDEIARVLRPGGRAILDITGHYNLSRIYHNYFYKKKGSFGVNSFSYSNITNKLNKLGFVIEESHALGFLDQYHYIPGIHKFKFLEQKIHGSVDPDLDYRVSNSKFFFKMANRWYFVVRKA
jgi:ubiquinone/menaquinone biosynthesis C-methylase UbiE